MNVRIAIAEDDKKASDALKSFWERFAKENGVRFDITVHSNAISLLNQYKPEYDVVFMDI